MKLVAVVLLAVFVRLASASTSDATDPEYVYNQVPGLIPRSGGWRGAVLGGTNPYAYKAEYKVDMHIWRVFTADLWKKPGMEAFIKDGGIAFLNPQLSNWAWYNGSREKTNKKIRRWAIGIAALKPAQVMFAPGFEVDAHVSGRKREKASGNNFSNTPEAHRAMWANIRRIFDENNATNVLMAIVYSGKIKNENKTVDLIRELWPGDHLVDWLFFNIFNLGGKGNYVKTVNKSYSHLLERAGPGFNFTAKPWGLGAFGTTNLTKGKGDPRENRANWLADAKSELGQSGAFPRLKAYVYFDAKKSKIADYIVKPAYQSFWSDPFFNRNDKVMSPYTLSSRKAVTCHEDGGDASRGTKLVMAEVECETAAAALGKTWLRGGSWTDRPTGCSASRKGVSFNKNAAGLAHLKRQLVCKREYTTSSQNSMTCPGGTMLVMMKRECKIAAEALGIFYKKSVSRPNGRNGCFTINNVAFFNTNGCFTNGSSYGCFNESNVNVGRTECFTNGCFTNGTKASPMELVADEAVCKLQPWIAMNAVADELTQDVLMMGLRAINESDAIVVSGTSRGGLVVYACMLALAVFYQYV